MKTFDEIAEQQGWDKNSRETVMRMFIESHPEGGGLAALAAFAQKVADEENQVPEGSSGKRVPDLAIELTGADYSGPYPTHAEYRVVGTTNPEDPEDIVIRTEASGGVSYRLLCTPEIVDGITSMTSINHGLDAYEDDWTLPNGMDRVLTWDVGGSRLVNVPLNASQIHEISEWLGFATGRDVWDWAENGSEWSY